MHASEKLSLERIRQLVAASEGLRFESENRRQMYAWVESVLIEHQFKQQGKVARGFGRRSRAEVERVVSEYKQSGLGRKEFCAAHGLSMHTLDAW